MDAKSPLRNAGRSALPRPSPVTVTATCCPAPVTRPRRRSSLPHSTPRGRRPYSLPLTGEEAGLREGKPRAQSHRPRAAGGEGSERRACGSLLQDTSGLWLDHVTPPASPGASVQALEGARSVGISTHQYMPGFPETCALAACLENKLPIDSPLSLSRPGQGEGSKLLR